MKKFKAFDLKAKEWVRSLDFINHLWKVNSNKSDDVVLDDGTQKEYAICIFTGLVDKNGQEIFEGHIVESITNIKYEVAIGSYFSKTDVGHGVHLCKNGDRQGHPTTICNMDSEKYEVVGNIFENPELIDEKQNEN